MTDFAMMDATAQAALVRAKQVKPIELLEAAIKRIEEANPRVNAVITTMYDEARKTATGALSDGPFTGVPFLLKDGGAGAYAGIRQTGGTKYLMDYVSPEDSELTRRFKAAGLVICGKTNLPEFGLQPTTEPEATGPTRNPWNTELTSGGSSGGAAAAVATRMLPLAHASDAGGSIRVPASCCGVFGMKPTRYRIVSGRRSQGVSVRAAMATDGSVSMSVRDAAALLDAVAGGMPGDPYFAPAAPRPYAQEVGADPGRLRIVFSRGAPSGVDVDADCVAAVEDAAKLCESLGHHVEEGVPRIKQDGIYEPMLAYSSAGLAWDLRNWNRLTGKELRPEYFEVNTWTMYERGKDVSAEQMMDALAGFQSLADQFAAFFRPYDIWLSPTLASPPLPLGSFKGTPEDPTRGLRASSAFLPFTPLMNITGQPAMSVPLYWNSANVPIGVHFAARYGDEGTLFRLASQLEAARPWASRIPPTAAKAS